MYNVLDLIRELGIDPIKVAGTYGGEYHSPCPGCGGDDRFHVWPAENNGDGSYWCRQCEKAGDNIQFARDFLGLSYQEACRKVGRSPDVDQQYHTPRPPGSKGQRTGDRRQRPENQNNIPCQKWQEKASLFVGWCHERLAGNKHRLSWLKKRGITTETAKRFQLGWNPGKDGKDLWRPRESWGLETVLKNNGQKKRLWLPMGLVIPHFQDGEPRRIRIRRPKGEPRYYVVPGSNMDCMLMRPGSRAFVVVEAELDAMLCDQEAGEICGAVATGSSSAKPDTRTVEELKRAAIILLAQDYDGPGAKALAWWQQEFPQAERWPVPKGKDPGEAYEQGVDLKTWIRSVLPPCWRFGPSFEKKKKRKARDDRGQTMADSKTVEVAESVKELAELLKRHPVSIRVTVDRTYVRHSQKWAAQNWMTAKRLSELVFMTDEVMDFLEGHPDEIITRENIL